MLVYVTGNKQQKLVFIWSDRRGNEKKNFRLLTGFFNSNLEKVIAMTSTKPHGIVTLRIKMWTLKLVRFHFAYKELCQQEGVHAIF
jgi:hypothetical protein